MIRPRTKIVISTGTKVTDSKAAASTRKKNINSRMRLRASSRANMSRNPTAMIKLNVTYTTDASRLHLVSAGFSMAPIVIPINTSTISIPAVTRNRTSIEKRWPSGIG